MLSFPVFVTGCAALAVAGVVARELVWTLRRRRWLKAARELARRLDELYPDEE